MAQIKTKFHVGDKVVTIGKETQKATDIVVGCITASMTAKNTSICIHPLKSTDGDIDWYTSYDERYCFTSREELMKYINS